MDGIGAFDGVLRIIAVALVIALVADILGGGFICRWFSCLRLRVGGEPG